MRGRTLWVALPLGTILWLGSAVSLAAPPNSCMDCHRQLDDARLRAPTLNIDKDIHTARGLGCANCHGGNPNDPELSAMDPDKGFKGKPARNEIAELCASCHANAAFMKHYNPRPYIFSLDEFRTSVHCKKISEGDTKVATCTNCHGVHGILSPKDPDSPVYHKNVPETCGKCHNATYMKGRNIPTNQHDLYVKSVHGRALLEKGDMSAPACNDCHGNHGAVPPGVRDVSLVCGKCHVREAELFEASRVKDMMELQGKRACVTCHSNHDVQHPTDAMLSPEPGGLCGQCHVPGSTGDKAAREIVTRFAAMDRGIAHADSLAAAAESLGMETDETRATLREARDRMTNVRAALHSFDRKTITDVLAEGEKFVRQATDQAAKLLQDWRNRRVGMALSLVVILVLIGLLVLRIRGLEKGEPAPG
jgi:doubled CXXCH motif protein